MRRRFFYEFVCACKEERQNENSEDRGIDQGSKRTKGEGPGEGDARERRRGSTGSTTSEKDTGCLASPPGSTNTHRRGGIGLIGRDEVGASGADADECVAFLSPLSPVKKAQKPRSTGIVDGPPRVTLDSWP
jgi:hypothetical protein